MTTGLLVLLLAFGSDDPLEQARQRRRVAEQAASRQAVDAILRAALAYPHQPREGRRILKEMRQRMIEDADIRERHRARLAWVLERFGG